MIVTSRDSDMDELISMNLGADDFVTKPYNLQILLARISRILQRSYEHASSNQLMIHDIVLDISKSTLNWKGNSVDLTKNELRIMHCLFQNKKCQVVFLLFYSYIITYSIPQIYFYLIFLLSITAKHLSHTITSPLYGNVIVQ